MIKKAASILSAVCLLAILLYLATLLLIPKYMEKTKEGSLISEYYSEIEKGLSHQVIFVGDCEVYESFVPPLLWEKYGISSYVRGSPQQLIWQSYYLLEEMLEYERPEAVVFNVLSMKYGEPQREEYNRLTLDGMRWSKNKLLAIKASMTDKESVTSYIFPLLRYHSRWKELTQEDFKYMFKREPISHNGYLMNLSIKAVKDDIEASPLIDSSLPDICFDYLDKMRELCAKKGIRLILVKAPTNSWRYWWYDEWDRQICAYAERFGIDYYNFIGNEEIAIDWSKDTYDGGVHLNVYGAEKMTKYFGRLLSEKYNIESRWESAELSSAWREKLENFYEERNDKVE